MDEINDADLWPVLPCAYSACREKREDFGLLCRSHRSSEFREARECEKCGMYAVKVVDIEGCIYCRVCWDTISDFEPKSWCRYRTARTVCTRSEKKECAGLCRTHFLKFDRCGLCGVFRDKGAIPPSIRDIDIFGGLVCRACVERTRRMSALLPVLPYPFVRAQIEAEEVRRGFEERHRDAEAKRREAESSGDSEDADDESGSDSENDGPYLGLALNSDGDHLDRKHVEEKSAEEPSGENPIATRTRGSKRPREEGKCAESSDDDETEDEEPRAKRARN